MAVSFVGTTNNNAINGGDVVIDLTGLGLQQGDFVIIAYGVGDNDNVDEDMVVSGWTEVADLFANDTQDVDLGVFYKVMGASPDTSATATGRGGTDAAVQAIVMAFRGVDTTTPLDVTSTTATGINTAHADPPAITWSTSGAWTVIAAASGHTGGGNISYTFPTGYTTDANSQSANDTSDVAVGMGYNSSPASTENPGTLTCSSESTNNCWAAVTMAIRPSSAATFERSSAVDASVDIASTGEFFSILEANVAVDSSIAIASTPQRELLRASGTDLSVDIASDGTIVGAISRSASVDLSPVIATSGTSFTIEERNSATDVSISIVSAGQRDLLRAVAVDASVDIATTGQVIPAGGPTTWERASDIDITLGIATTGQLVSVSGTQIFQTKGRNIRKRRRND